MAGAGSNGRRRRRGTGCDHRGDRPPRGPTPAYCPACDAGGYRCPGCGGIRPRTVPSCRRLKQIAWAATEFVQLVRRFIPVEGRPDDAPVPPEYLRCLLTGDVLRAAKILDALLMPEYPDEPMIYGIVAQRNESKDRLDRDGKTVRRYDGVGLLCRELPPLVDGDEFRSFLWEHIKDEGYHFNDDGPLTFFGSLLYGPPRPGLAVLRAAGLEWPPLGIPAGYRHWPVSISAGLEWLADGFYKLTTRWGWHHWEGGPGGRHMAAPPGAREAIRPGELADLAGALAMLPPLEHFERAEIPDAPLPAGLDLGRKPVWAAAPDPGPRPPAPAADGAGLTKKSLIIAALHQAPGASVREIADRARCSPGYATQIAKAVREKLKGCELPPRGSKGRDGRMEAWADE